MNRFQNFGTALAMGALIVSASAQAATRSAAVLPQDVVVHPVMPEGAEIINDDALDYCFKGDIFSRRGVLLEADAACGKSAGTADAGNSFLQGGGTIMAAITGLLAVVGIVSALGNDNAVPDSPGG